MDEVAGAGDRAVHVRFRRQVQQMRYGVFPHDFEDGWLVAEIDLLEHVFRMLSDGGEVFDVPGVGEAVEVDEPLDFRAVDDVVDHVRPDESGAASDEEVHAIRNEEDYRTTGPKIRHQRSAKTSGAAEPLSKAGRARLCRALELSTPRETATGGTNPDRRNRGLRGLRGKGPQTKERRSEVSKDEWRGGAAVQSR